jgi:lipoprotein-anchoring transpeptidase ErfK/SrfK
MKRRTFLITTLGCVSWFNPVSGSAATAPLEEDRYRISRDDYKKVAVEYLPQLVDYAGNEPAGAIVVDPVNYFLYLILGSGRAKRYGVGVGREGFGWSGTATVGRKAEWPRWVPPKEMMARDPKAARWPDGMPGGGDNPLGARALYLYEGEVDTLLRIHGTPEAASIGRAVSSGCIRMLNADIVELYDRVAIGAKVTILRAEQPVVTAEPAKEPEPVAEKPIAAAEETVRPEVRSLRAPRAQPPKPARRRTVGDWLKSLEERG